MNQLAITEINDQLAVFLPPEAIARLNASAGGNITLIESPNGYELVANAQTARQIEIARGVMRDDAEALAKLAE